VRRAALVAALVGVGFWLAAPAAWGDPTPICNGQQCVRGLWYTSPVSLTWNLNGGTNGGGCAPQNYLTDTNQSYLQSEPMADWPAWTYCYDPSSGVLKDYFIEVEISSPSATVAPARPPDSNGWYNHPVAAAVNGSSFSGIASCSGSIYAGPSTTSATVSGTCTDNAGKSVSAASAPFDYDATSPSLTATATPNDGSVTLNWQTGGDIAPIGSVEVVRSPDPAGAAIYSGTANAYQDNHVRNGVRYRYMITARDQAGNASTTTVVATPGPRLLGPINGAHLTLPPMLSWTPVPGATYYNVQLYRGGKTKVLSIWPTHAALQLQRTWRFDRRRYKLKPGRYRWYVWPGFGKRRAARYGHVVGSGTFVMVR
jgi:hypothetical protein